MPLHYEQLDPSIRQIRLFTLLPPSEGRISGLLHVVFLDERLVFDALSYVWGVEDDLDPIFINGEAFKVTKNLKAALSRLQESEPLVMWVDAICINQESIEEKNHQLPLMRDIYTRASKVIAWLGEGDEYIDALFRFAQGLVDNRHSSSGTRSMRSRPLRDMKAHIGILNLFLLPYWQRIWTFQEITLPESDPVCVYGKLRCDLSVFLISSEHGIFKTRRAGDDKALAAELACLDSSTYGASDSDSVSIFHSRFYTEVSDFGIDAARKKRLRGDYSASLFELLAATFRRKSSDARDRVYALYGLVKHTPDMFPPGYSPEDSLENMFPPDYSQENSLEKVLVQTTTWLIDSGDGPDLLDIFGLHSSRFSENSSLPSWVPDFNSRSYYVTGHPVIAAVSLRQRSAYDLRPPTHDRNVEVLLRLPGIGVVAKERPEREAIPASFKQFNQKLEPWVLEWLQRQGFDVSLTEVQNSPSRWRVIRLPAYCEPNVPHMAGQGKPHKQSTQYFLGGMPAIRITARNLGRCRLVCKFEEGTLAHAGYINEMLWGQRSLSSWIRMIQNIEWIRKLTPMSETSVDPIAAALQTSECYEIAMSYEDGRALFRDKSLRRKPLTEEFSFGYGFAAFIQSSAAAMNGFNLFAVDILGETCVGFTREPVETGDLVIMPLAPYQYPLVLRKEVPKDPNSAETGHKRPLHGTWDDLDWHRMVGLAFVQALEKESILVAQLVRQMVEDFYIR